jgi:hypothetical protein
MRPFLLCCGAALAAFGAGAEGRPPATTSAAVSVTGAASDPVAAAQLPLRRWQVEQGAVQLRWNLDLTRPLGFVPAHVSTRVATERSDALIFDAPVDQVRAYVGGTLARAPGIAITVGKRRILIDAIVQRAGKRRELALIDARGREWFYVDNQMALFESASARLRVLTADVRITPALAALLGEARYAGLAVGDLKLEARARALDPAPTLAKSCAAPNWPNRNGFVADVLLEAIAAQQMRCRRSTGLPNCDGPGVDDGEVVLTPDAVLRNSDLQNTAEVPWYTQFYGPPATPGDYPYQGHDQHPFLVWSLYRIDGSGRLEQVGRSGLKQAFATLNEGCSDPTCVSGGHILGRGCSDPYTVGSNDAGFFLGPRREVIASRGQWGRCGSALDDVVTNPIPGLVGCDGVQDSPVPDDGYRDRMVVRESRIDPALNPGARWLFEAWYVVRDDVNIYNTMGTIEIEPSFVNTTWLTPTIRGFRRGPAIDEWIAPATTGGQARNTELVTPEGRMRLAVRVSAVAGGWRYDYALMNFDFSRPVTENAEPNLRVIRNLGIDRLSLNIDPAASDPTLEFADGNSIPSDDWSASRQGGEIAWQAPTGAALDWGSLYRFSVVAAQPPAESTMMLRVAEAGMPASYTIATLGPDALGRLLVSGTEDGELPP